MGEFLRLTIEKKKRGELKKEELQTIKQTIYPYLNDEQKQNLNQVKMKVNLGGVQCKKQKICKK